MQELFPIDILNYVYLELQPDKVKEVEQNIFEDRYLENQLYTLLNIKDSLDEITLPAPDNLIETIIKHA